jgi:hypothetical protein
METKIVEDMELDEIRALFASATKLTISGKEEKTLEGEGLERFKRFLEIWLLRSGASAKALLAGRRASEITPEEKESIIVELAKMSIADDSRAEELSEGPFVKRQRETLDKMRKCYEESGSWHKVYTTEVYTDSGFCAEVFIDFVERNTGENVRDTIHLLALTGLTGETDTMEGFEKTMRQARESRYERTLARALDEGAKYKDLLEIDPKDFGFSGDTISDFDEMSFKQGFVRLAIACWADLMESSVIRPDLRAVADNLEAPFKEIWAATNFI